MYSIFMGNYLYQPPLTPNYFPSPEAQRPLIFSKRRMSVIISPLSLALLQGKLLSSDDGGTGCRFRIRFSAHRTC